MDCTHSLSYVDLSSFIMMDFNDHMISIPELLAPSPPSPLNYQVPHREHGGPSEKPTSSTEAHHATQTVSKKRRNLSHSFSEKRRREKIKANLQRLRDAIPNSQNLDIASLLDKAITRIKTLACQLHQMSQITSRMPQYTNVPPYKMQFMTGTRAAMPPFAFVPQMIPNYVTTSMNGSVPMVHPVDPFMPFFPQTQDTVAGSIISASLPPPNAYGWFYDQSQSQARNSFLG